MKITEINASTQEVIERDMNEAELNQWNIDQQNNELQAQTEADLLAAKAVAKAKLAALGLTSDDLKALGLGGN